MSALITFIVGFFAGVLFGVFLIALLQASRTRDDDE